MKASRIHIGQDLIDLRVYSPIGDPWGLVAENRKRSRSLYQQSIAGSQDDYDLVG